MVRTPRYVYVADDFTGATDTLATLARTGLAVRLFLDVPTPDTVSDLDAFGIATEARALGTVEIRALMREIGGALSVHQPEILHLKVCSTFDSAQDTGNFAAAMAVLTETVGIRRQAILGGQPSLGRYCVFGNLFARSGDGCVHRIDRHPVMRAHPVTPMAESDLAEHVVSLGGQRPLPLDRLTLDDAPRWPDDGRAVLFDALDGDDIERIGGHLRNAAPLVCAGASSVAEAVMGTSPHRPPSPVRLDAPVLGFAGSRSVVTGEQVARAGAFARIAMSPERLCATEGLRGLAAEALDVLASGRNVLLVIEESGPAAIGPRELARSSAELVAEILRRGSIGALMVAGGDTSSAIVRRLKPRAIAFAGDIDRGVPLCHAEFDNAPTLPLVLKGGQVGQPGLFDDIATRIFSVEPT